MRRPSGLATAMLFGSFAWSFVYVSLPFHVQAISTLDATATLQWTGWILGISPLVTVVTAPLWGLVAERGNAKALYTVIALLQAVSFGAMALARTLVELLLARLSLGVMGAASTFAFVIAGQDDDPTDVRRQVAAVQSAMTVGQVLGPLAGALVAARIGFRASFVVGAVVLLGCALLVRWGVPATTPRAAGDGRAGGARVGDVAAVCLIVLAGSTHVFFLPAILPQVLAELGVAPSRTLEVGGLLIFASGVAAALGSLAAPRLGDLVGERRLLPALLVASSVTVALLGAAASIWSYGVVRFLQVLAIAPVFPLIVAQIAARAGGQAIGFINSARLGAAFLGPVAATAILARTSPAVLYVLLAAVAVACVPLTRLGAARSARPVG